MRVGAATQPIVVLFDGQIHFLFLFILPSPFSGVLFISIAFFLTFVFKGKENKRTIQYYLLHVYSPRSDIVILVKPSFG